MLWLKKKSTQWGLKFAPRGICIQQLNNRSIGKTPFEIVYGQHIPHILDQSPISYYGNASANVDDIINHIKSVQKDVFNKLQVSNAQYKDQSIIKDNTNFLRVIRSWPIFGRRDFQLGATTS